MNFLDFQDLQKNIATKLNFENGQVSVKPFTLKYKDIPIEVSGGHTFSNNLQYDVVFQVPAKYLGSEVNRLIGKINDPEVNKISIPVTANINGSFTSPNISTDLTSGISNLTQQLIEIEKQKLIGKGKDKINDLLGGVLGGKNNTTKTDSTTVKTDSSKTDPKDKIKEGVKDAIGDLFGGKKKSKDQKAQDSTKSN